MKLQLSKLCGTSYQSHQSGIETGLYVSGLFCWEATNRTNLELKPVLEGLKDQEPELPIAPIWN